MRRGKRVLWLLLRKASNSTLWMRRYVFDLFTVYMIFALILCLASWQEGMKHDRDWCEKIHCVPYVYYFKYCGSSAAPGSRTKMSTRSVHIKCTEYDGGSSTVVEGVCCDLLPSHVRYTATSPLTSASSADKASSITCTNTTPRYQ